MTTLAQFTSPRWIVPQLAAEDAHGAIAELAGRLQSDGVLPDVDRLLHAVLNRETICPTVCSPGWALPHARLPDLTRLSFALGRAKRPIAWLGQPQVVSLVWLFVVPELESKAYLGLVGAVARLNQNPALAQALLEAPDATTLESLLAQARLHAGAVRRLATTPA